MPDDAEAKRLGEQKRMISARLDGVRVLNLYVPNGSSVGSIPLQARLAQLSAAFFGGDRRTGWPLCVVGDFNIAPEAETSMTPSV